jgi:hypothetical protein
MTTTADNVYRTIGKLGGVNVLFDLDYKPQKITIELNEVMLREALNMVALESKTFWRPISSTAIFVASEGKRKEFEDNVMRTFYLRNASTSGELQEVAGTLKGMLEINRIQVNATHSSITVRGTPDQMVLEYGAAGIAGIDFGASLRVVPDPIGRATINYKGPVRTYPYVSLADVVARKFPPGTFRGKIVLVGASATGIGDLRSTPYGGLDYPGVEIHANVIDNILHQNFLLRGPRQVLVDLILIFLCGLPLGLWLALAQPRWLLLGLLLIVPLTGGIYYAFLQGWWLNFSIPALTLVSNVGMVALYRALVEEREKRNESRIQILRLDQLYPFPENVLAQELNRFPKAELVWFKPWRKVLKWDEPFAQWFVGGQLNVSYNCLDRHLGTPLANKAALIWEGEPAAPGKPGEERTLTYKQLHHEVCRFANVLKRNGITRGDRILIYLPMVPEAAIAMLACARIGAPHSVVFGGFSTESLRERMNDCGAKAHACAGESKIAKDPNSWIYVPLGTCAKIEGGSTTPKKA